ncbi:MAG: UDP-N-acetylmuramoyl-tripeptide--D-alanyl-D-alanine ligase [Caulobacteraceae bacterium]
MTAPLGTAPLGTTPLWTAAEIVAATGGRASAPFAATGVSIDTRTLEGGDLFVALSGERDGHGSIPAALAAGAAGALASRPMDGPAVMVDDTQTALEHLGEAARLRARQARRGAVTGSVGKTSVTQAIRAGLIRAGPAHGSVKSYNNHIGVPLTLARMPAATRRAIFEIGMNRPGEIAPLARQVQPHAVAITNVEAVHVENFPGGEAQVAKAKAEIFAGIERGGVAVLNADNPWFDYLKGEARRAGAKPRVFGRAKGADARLVRFSPARGGASVEASLDGKDIEFPIPQSAAHWGPMSLCALLMLQALDVDLDTALAALGSFRPLEGRGAERVVRGPAGAFTLIDESYNASPVSMAAALAALGARSGAARRIVALTDMLELGPASAERHAALAAPIAAAGVDLVFCAGPAMEALWRALPADRRGAWTPGANALAPLLSGAVAAGDAVMVKGSHASNAATLVAALAALETAGGRA